MWFNRDCVEYYNKKIKVGTTNEYIMLSLNVLVAAISFEEVAIKERSHTPHLC